MKFFGFSLATLAPTALLLSNLPSVLGVPQPVDTVAALGNPIDKRSAMEDDFLPVLIPREASSTLKDLAPNLISRDLLKRSAELFWGPIYIGNLKLYLTNPHMGYAGPRFPNANHINFHVDKKLEGPRGKYGPVVNMHIVKYENAKTSQCLYIWESETKKVVFDSCFDDFTDGIKEGVKAVKDFVSDLLKDADWIASFAIIAALVVALIAAITALGAVAIA